MRDVIQRTYTALWNAGADVCYPPEERFTGGKFYDGNKIDIYRPSAVDSLRFEPHWHRSDGTELTDDELLRELFSLAHEYGHMRSYETGTWQGQQPALERFVAAVQAKRPVDVADHAAVLAEERRAWNFARTELTSLGWTDWDLFDAAAARALKSYEDTPHT